MRPPNLRRGVAGRGFTLIELLVAISILAIVAVLGWRGLDSIVRARQSLTVQLEQSRGMQLAFAQMQSDLEHLATKAQLHQRANLSGQDNRLTLVRTVFADNEAARLQVVAYRVVDGVLTRRESIATRDLTLLNSMWQATLGDTDSATQVRLQADVNGMGVRLWEGMNWRNAAGDSDSSTSASSTVLTTAANSANATVQNVAAAATAASEPTGMEVSLQLAGQATTMVKVFLLGAV